HYCGMCHPYLRRNQPCLPPFGSYGLFLTIIGEPQKIVNIRISITDNNTEAGMAKLSTHVLDTRRGQPASGLRIDLYRIHRDDRELVLSVHTNQDGRTDEPLLQGEALRAGTY